MYPDYDYFYIPLTSKYRKLHPQTNNSPRNNNPFSSKPAVVWVKISEKKKHKFFQFEISLRQASK